jgi:glycosyltransferase involved in cell wall biosynthesis
MVIPWNGASSRRAPALFFLVPDFDRPSGGVMVMYRHVDLLNAAGITAFVLHQRPHFRCSWFENQTKVTDAVSIRIGPEDVVVVTEPDVDLLCRDDRPIRHIILNQSGHLTWKRAADEVSQHYAHSKNLLGVVAVSQHVAEMLRFAFEGIRVHRVHNGIDPARFHPGDGIRQRVLSHMPRRGKSDFDQVMGLLRSRGTLRDWQTLPVDGLRHDAVPDVLRTSRIFVSLSSHEGFGLPAAEAMACGNYVVGYHGHGGKEFFRSPWACCVETGDVLGVARAIEHAVLQDRVDPGWCRQRGSEASKFILNAYSQDREREDVVHAYAELSGFAATTARGIVA